MADCRSMDGTAWQRASVGGFGESVSRKWIVANVHVHTIGYGRSRRHQRRVRHGERHVQFRIRVLLRVLPAGEHALAVKRRRYRSEEHTSELQSLRHLVCRLLLE